MIITESLVNIHYNAHSQIFFFFSCDEIFQYLLSVTYKHAIQYYQLYLPTYVLRYHRLSFIIENPYLLNHLHSCHLLLTYYLIGQPIPCSLYVWAPCVLFFFFLKIAQISNIIDYFTLISLCIMFSKSISVIINRLFMQNILTTLSNHLNEIWKNKAW